MAEDVFRSQMAYLRQYCDVIRLEDVLFYQPAGNRPAVAVSFDDGFANNYHVAFPVLKEFSIPATIFLTTDFIDTNQTIWSMRINQAMVMTSLSCLNWEGHDYDLSTPNAKKCSALQMQNLYKSLAHAQLLEKVRSLVSALGSSFDEPLPEDSPYRMLTTAQIREMLSSGLLDFGAHTCAHAILKPLTSEQKRAEILDSLKTVERITGRPCRLFSYPNGEPCDYDAESVEIVRRGLCTAAVTTVAGPNTPAVPLLELRRFGVGDEITSALFKLNLHHLPWLLHRS